MGLFVVPENYSNATAEQEVEAAIANLKLWQQHRDNTNTFDYLLDMAEASIGRAKEKETNATISRL